jgi:hypothetical protein
LELPAGTPLDYSAIRRLVRNPRYHLPAVWYRSSLSKFHRLEGGIARKFRGNGKRRRNDSDLWLMGQAACPPIISQDVWDRAQEQLRKAPRPNGRRATSYIFGGFCVCGHCHRNLVGLSHFNQEDGTYMRCPAVSYERKGSCPGGAIRQSYLLEGVTDLLRRVLFAPENKSAIRKEIKKYVDGLPREGALRAQRLDTEMQTLDRRHAELQAALAGGDAGDVPVLLAAVRQNRHKHAQLASERAGLTVEPTIDAGAIEAHFWGICDRLQEVFAGGDADRIRGALMGIIERIEATWRVVPAKHRRRHPDRPIRAIKKLDSVTVILKDDPALRVLLVTGERTATRSTAPSTC